MSLRSRASSMRMRVRGRASQMRSRVLGARQGFFGQVGTGRIRARIKTLAPRF